MAPPLRAAAALGISYRPIGTDDLPFLALVYSSTRTEELAQTGWSVEMKEQFLAQQFNAQHSHYMRYYPDLEWLVIERGGESVGRLYYDEKGSEVRVVDIALLPEHRGLGLGTAILADIIEAAEAAGKPVGIHVEKSNSARHLYERLGFRLAGDAGIYDRMERRPESGESP